MRATALLLLAACGLACAGRPPVQTFTLITTEPAVAPRSMRAGVEGKFCFSQSFVRTLLTPPWRARRANHGYAVSAALESVPGANVLTRATLSVKVEQYLLFQRVCAIVTGNAGAVE